MTAPAEPKEFDGIDRSRPLVEIRGQGIPRVVMYYDDPGVYLDPHGKPVSEATAKMAGFDVVEDRKAKLVHKKMLEQAAELEAFRQTLELKKAGEVELAVASSVQKVDRELVKDIGGWFNKDDQMRGTNALEMEHIGGGLFQVLHLESGKMMLPDKARGDVCVQFMLDWHAQGEELGEDSGPATKGDAVEA